MPELPEIINFKNYVDSTSLHQSIDTVEVLNEKILENTTIDQLKTALEDTAFESTTTHGKYLFIQTDSRELMMHFGMTGKPIYFKDEEEMPDYPRVLFNFTNGFHLAFDCLRMLGKVRLIDDHDEFLKEKELGPDALQEVDNLDTFRELMDNKRGMIKTALMDQSLMAGIGNECSDEILYQSRIYPKKKVQDLTGKELSNLFETMHEVLQTKIESGLEIENLPETYILRHRSEGEECPICGGTIKQIKAGGRNAYYCPGCQSD